MTERKACIRCQRQIDAYARICPYCNWDQSDYSTPPPAPVQEAPYVPPDDRDWRRYALMAGGAVLLLIAAFLVGMWINSDAAPTNAPAPVTDRKETPAARRPRADVTLVPMPEGFTEPPITSAPAAVPLDGVPTEYQRSDATALSAVEYARIAERVKAEQQREAAMKDPRSITGPAYAQTPPRQPTPPEPLAEAGLGQTLPPPMTSESPEAEEPGRVVIRTRPVPLYQPLPDIRVRETVTAQLDLTIGTDGRVKEVNLREGIPGHTAELIAAVQRWKFKPATENGVPVTAPFRVDVSFKGDD